MSFNILGDHGLDIDITILKMVRRLENGELIERLDQTIPIGISAISSLKIEDSLMRTGMYGAIEINNKTSILNQLGIAAKSSDDLYISITIKDEELEESGLKPHQAKIEFLGLIEKTLTGSANFQDNYIIFQFEEAFVAEMRHTSWDNFLKEGGVKEDDAMTVTDLVEKYYDVVWKTKSKSEGVIVDSSEGMATMKLPLVANTEIKRPTEESFYDVFKRTLSRTSAASMAGNIFGMPTSFVQHLPSFRFANAENGIRMMKFKPYFTDKHRQFIEEVRLEGIQGASNDFSDVYTEKFTCGPLAQVQAALDPNTNWHNRIEGESITRPDVGTLRKEVWTNYLQVAGTEADVADKDFDIASNIINVRLYAKVVQNFIKDELALKEGGVNLPLIDPKSQVKKYLYTPTDDRVSDFAITTELFNKLKTSFVTVNEKISFTCKGAIYRTPGKFIWVERSAAEGESLLEKLWYVNSVEHSIIDGTYQTEIIANRMFGDNTIEAFEKSEKVAADFIDGNLSDDSARILERLEASGARGPVPPPERVQEKMEELKNKSAPPEPKFYKDPLTSEQIKKLQESDEYKKMSAQDQRRWNRENIPGYVDDQDRSIQQIREKDPEAFFTAQKAGQAAFQKYLKDNGFKK
jgi:hypothetical protein